MKYFFSHNSRTHPDASLEDKLQDIRDCLNKKEGIYLTLLFPYIHSNEALYREGGMITALGDTVTNMKGGDFPGKRHHEKRTPEQVFEKEEEMGLYTLFIAYETFRKQCNYPIRIIRDCRDIVSTIRYSTLSEYSENLKDAIDKVKDQVPIDTRQHGEIMTHFGQQSTEACFIFLYLDASILPASKTSSDYTFADFLKAITCIGYEKQINRPYENLKAAKEKRRQSVSDKYSI
uniref:Uncharacterized protein n=1 Tax=Panagrolaimus sp. PS1159 TaxID=55785 RepID=A0AC35G856_9BILA